MTIYNDLEDMLIHFKIIRINLSIYELLKSSDFPIEMIGISNQYSFKYIKYLLITYLCKRKIIMIYLYLLVFKIRRKLNEEVMPKNREKKALFELRYEKFV